MTAKRIFQAIVVVAVLAASFASTSGVLAGTGCASYITVQWGDTLSSIAAACGTTVEAIRAANPGLGWRLYAGQVLYIPTGYTSAPAYYPVQTGGSTYVVRWGDTLGDIAVRNGVSLSNILAVNPQIWNASLIYSDQVINLPVPVNVSTSTYYPPTYYPPMSYPPTPCPPTPCPSTSYPPPTDYSQFSDLKVTYGHGLLVRTGPGKNYREIQSPLVSAVKNTHWRYRNNSVTVDSKGFVWVEVALGQMVNGYSTGWILVKDSLGNYFTNPHIDP
jgi:LysM repeat protein